MPSGRRTQAPPRCSGSFLTGRTPPPHPEPAPGYLPGTAGARAQGDRLAADIQVAVDLDHVATAHLGQAAAGGLLHLRGHSPLVLPVVTLPDVDQAQAHGLILPLGAPRAEDRPWLRRALASANTRASWTHSGESWSISLCSSKGSFRRAAGGSLRLTVEPSGGPPTRIGGWRARARGGGPSAATSGTRASCELPPFVKKYLSVIPRCH